jgi:sugar phosphate isomerase/epimerase
MTIIGVQLYSLREELKQDHDGTLRRIAEIGYNGVETAGEFGGSVRQAATLYQSLGLKVVGAHIRLPDAEGKSALLDTLGALGTNNWVCPWLPPERFTSLDSVKAVCDDLNQADELARANGLRLFYHNHHFEFLPLPDGTLPYMRMLEWLAPSVMFEVDTYWVHVAGVNVVDILHKLDSRAGLLHIKDGPGALGQSMLAVGEGVMQFPPILQASHADALIVELDACATDMLTAVDTSYHNLKALM